MTEDETIRKQYFGDLLIKDYHDFACIRGTRTYRRTPWSGLQNDVPRP